MTSTSFATYHPTEHNISGSISSFNRDCLSISFNRDCGSISGINGDCVSINNGCKNT